MLVLRESGQVLFFKKTKQQQHKISVMLKLLQFENGYVFWERQGMCIILSL